MSKETALKMVRGLMASKGISAEDLGEVSVSSPPSPTSSPSSDERGTHTLKMMKASEESW